ncbi:MAG: NAD-dependent epimerase/dehydratase family protein [Planctomycetota bacterium]|nr:MAG: NAD-dependent epimerase/dehydratase family protein [Planctomycetota bacterium]
MARILITGYGGFLGSRIARLFLQAGWTVRGLARRRYPDLERAGVEAIRGDICDAAVVLEATRDCDAIVHTAARAGVWGPWDAYYSVNTVATRQLLEAARHNCVRAFVHTSSPSVTFAGEHQSGVDESVPYPQRWLCHYPHTKALAEQDVLEASRDGTLRTCALRPHLIWGQGDPHLFPRVVQRALQGRLRRVGSGENLIDVVHVDAAASAHVAAVERLMEGDERINGRAFFLSDGRPVPCWQWIRRILTAADVQVPEKSISYPAAYRLGAVLEWAYRLSRISAEPPMTRFVAAQLALDHYFNIDAARQCLAYQPLDDLDEQFDRCRPWLREVAGRMRKGQIE